MGRKKDPQTGYRLQEHRINGYVYATTQRTVPGKNGTPVRRHVHWGEGGRRAVFADSPDGTAQAVLTLAIYLVATGRSFEQILDVALYDLDAHLPEYYRAFPGNIPDSRTVRGRASSRASRTGWTGPRWRPTGATAPATNRRNTSSRRRA